jgi:predicted dehydrogenase
MGESIDRRLFFGRAAFASAAAGLPAEGQVRTEEPSPPTEAPSNDVPKEEQPLRTVIVGVMGLGRGAALAAGLARQPAVEIRYVCDVDSLRLGAVAADVEKATGSPPQAVVDFRRILDDPQVDALFCAAPNHWHGPATLLACAAGKHVYVEKPCSHNPWEGEAMVRASQRYARAVQMGAQRRSSPVLRPLIGSLHAGRIGRIYFAASDHSATRSGIGHGVRVEVPPHLNYELWQGPAPRRPYVDNCVHYNWHWRWHWGNGELGNNGVHGLDICRWGMGVDYPTRVCSSGGRYRYDDDQETPDTHVVTFEFEGDRAICWTGTSCSAHGGAFVTFFGEEGTVEVDGSCGYRLFDRDDRLVESVEGARGDDEHLGDFLRAIREETPQRLNLPIEEGHKSTLLCHLGNIAHRTGRALTCDPTRGSIEGDTDAMRFWQREYAEGWEPSVG